MQAFKAKIHLIGLIILLAACAGPETAVPPTPLISDKNTQPVAATPTLAANPTATPQSQPATDPVGASASPSLGDPYIPELGNTGYDVQQYVLQLALDLASPQVQGTTRIQALAEFDQLSQLSLDFIGFAISRVSVDGKAVPHQRDGGKLIINLPQPLAAGTPFEITIGYSGTPVREPSPYVGFSEALGLQYVDGRSLYALSEPDGARYWFPANDHPRDKARFRFEITVPAGSTAVANGHLLTTETHETTTTFIWEHNYPMATYLALVAVGPYERIDAVSPGGIPLRHYTFAESREGFETAVAVTGEAIDWMSQLLGTYPFEEFGYVAADVPGASMETQTMVLLSSNMTGQRTAVHEMAHMWFGDWVSLDSWQEMWRNEGFATYITMMWENRGDPEGLDLEVAGALAAAAENDPQYPLGSPPPEYLFGFNTYFEGAAMVHALRQEVGDEAFFAGLRSYFQQYGGGIASDSQFQAVMEQASGQSLDAFFAQWLR
ncbi:MAG: M1 family metallopeptidase [Ardenticatenaceae bacterium]|nr:M1 family metallopeptidase [Ardenticatenaceae bacterium]MCB9446446.1 M1 family metallopeptidase [Ardenticatenaceae bacterium]